MWKKIKNYNNYSVNENGEVRNDISGKVKSAYVCKKTDTIMLICGKTIKTKRHSFTE